MLIGYFFLNQDIIAKTLCIKKTDVKNNCNGKCYLAKKFKQTDENKRESKQIPPIKINIKQEYFQDINEEKSFVVSINTIQLNFYNNIFVCKGFLSDILKPPTV
ncbi:MAG: hypothetical protein ACK4K9_02305 [Bacteroidia bacterium]